MAAVKTLVDRPAFWSVPLPPARAVAWIARHAPRDWRLGERGGTTSSGRQQSWELGFSPPGANLAQAALLVTAVPAARGSSLVRVDAQAVWYPPRPKGSLVPSSASELTVTLAPERHGGDSMEPLTPPVAIVSDPSKVRSVALAVNRLRIDVDTVESCVAIPVSPAYVWISFRERPHRPAVAVARVSPYECSGGGSVALFVRGHRAPPLGESVRLIGEIEHVLGVKLKGQDLSFAQGPGPRLASIPRSPPLTHPRDRLTHPRAWLTHLRARR